MIAALEEYKRAILNDDGKAALRVITTSTVAAFVAVNAAIRGGLSEMMT